MSMLKRTLLAITLLSFAVAGCSDDDTPAGSNGGGGTDNDPPGIASVTAVDAMHINVTFDEDVNRETAERGDHYVVIEATPMPVSRHFEGHTASPGDTLYLTTVALESDNRTVSLNALNPMGPVPYALSVTGVADLNGNRITTPVVTSFTGTDGTDTTPPEISYRSPGPGQTNVGLAQPLLIFFNENVFVGTVYNGISWTSTGGPVAYETENDGGNRFSFTPTQPLATGTVYTVSLSGVEDYAGNVMPTTSWTFTTRSTADTTPPQLVSSSPADLATGVSVNANLTMTFSEPVDQFNLDVGLTPDVGDGIPTWSNGGRTVTFDPDIAFMPNQYYVLTILPGDVYDLSGNSNIEVITIRFSTGGSVPGGSFAGTISGDANSATASDPTGGVVIAADRSLFDNDDFGVLGSDVVGNDDTYDISNLPDDAYYPVSALDSNGDGTIDPDEGDAIGAYGVDFSSGDTDPDSVIIVGGNRVTDVDFGIFDPSAIVGSVSYSGMHSGGDYYFYVGVFDTTGFDPTASPIFGESDYWPYNDRFTFNSFDGSLADGVYYVGAFLDLSGEGNYDPATEPAGFFGGSVPAVVNIANGSDQLGADIVMVDPVMPVSSAQVAWPVQKREGYAWFRRLSAAVREAQHTGSR